MKYILTIDQGTTGTTTFITEAKGLKIIDKINKEHKQIYPAPGLVEHNLDEIWKTLVFTIGLLLKRNNILPSQIECIGITNQRETTCAFDNKGNPLANAIVWQDRRTALYCQKLKNKGKEGPVRTVTGLPIDPYFSASKMNWLLKNDKNIARARKDKNLKFGTVDTFLLYKLSGCLSYATEVSNASRTMLMDLKTCDWNPLMLKIFGINRSLLPEIRDSFGHFGKTKGLDFLPDGIPITGILGDQQSALLGQAGIHKGDIKCTYGTGAFLLLNTGKNIVQSSSGLLSTVFYKHKSKITYALEGSCYIAGAAVQWLRDNLGIINESHEIEDLAKKVKTLSDMEHLLFLPFFTGIGSPYWNPYAKAAIVGMTRDTESSHLAKACLEGIALSIDELITIMSKEARVKLKSLKVDGGATQNNLLMRIQATISQLDLIRPRIIETTSMGALIAAAIGHNLVDVDKISSIWKKEKIFKENKSETGFYQRKKRIWKDNISRIYL